MRAPRRHSRWATGRVVRRVRCAGYITAADWFHRRERWHADDFVIADAEPVCAVCRRAWQLRDGDLRDRTHDRLGNELRHDLPLPREHHGPRHEQWDDYPGVGAGSAWESATVAIIATLRRVVGAHHQRTERM